MNKGTREGGFALVLALMLMALVLLLLLSVSTLVRVESRVSRTGLQQTQAEQNAKLGLMIAVGELQRYTGPDTRVTAAGDILDGGGGAIAEPRWTGVWMNDPTASRFARPELMSWLVSGNQTTDPLAFDPSFDSNLNDAMVLFRSESESVSVPIVEVEPTSGSGAGGSFAFWIADEGLKSKIFPKIWELLPDQGEAAQIETARRVGVERARVDLEREDTPEPLDELLEMANAALSRLQSLQDLVFVGKTDADPATLEKLPQSVFHDLTPYGYGVLADSGQGGLRLDLTSYFEGSAPNPPPALPVFDDGRIADWKVFGAGSPPAPKWRYLRDFYRFGKRGDGSTVRARPTTADQHGIYPIVQQIGLAFGVSTVQTGTIAPGRIHLFPFVVLWNPYNVVLEGDYQIDFEFNQWLKGEYYPDRDTAAPNYQPLGPITLFPEGEGQDTSSHLRFDMAPFDLPSSDSDGFSFQISDLSIPPGRAIVLTPEADAPYVIGGQNSLKVGLDTVSSFHYPIGFDLDSTPDAEGNPPRFEYLVSRNHTTIVLRDGDGDVLQRSGSFPSIRGETIYTKAPFRLRTYAPDTENWLGYGHSDRLSGRGHYPQLAVANPRARNRSPGFLEKKVSYFTMQRVANWWPDLYVSSNWVVDLVEGPFRFTGSSPRRNATPPISSGARDFVSGAPRSVVFDLPDPAFTPASLGFLRHVNFSDAQQIAPSYAFGNSLAPIAIQAEELATVGSDPSREDNYHLDFSYLVNEIFWDRFFLSSLPLDADQNDLRSGRALANPRMKVLANRGSPPDIEDLRSVEGAARHLLIDGAFNVNSTSVEAWAAQLASLNETTVSDIAGGRALENPVLRQLKPLAASNPMDLEDRWSGFREIGTDELYELARAIVDQVKLRGPFASLSDFANRRLIDPSSDPGGTRLAGALETAIENSGLNPTVVESTTGEDDEPVLGMGTTPYIVSEHQRAGDRLMSAYAPGFLTQADILGFLAPVLAARSDTFRVRAYGRDASGSASAYCEAVLQRMPGPLDPVFGRPYKMVKFRWLSEDEL